MIVAIEMAPTMMAPATIMAMLVVEALSPWTPLVSLMPWVSLAGRT
jgi:hypothetical protein